MHVPQPEATSFNPLLRTGTPLGAGGLYGGSTSIAAISHSLTEIPSTCQGVAEGVRWSGGALAQQRAFQAGDSLLCYRVQGAQTSIEAHQAEG